MQQQRCRTIRVQRRPSRMCKKKKTKNRIHNISMVRKCTIPMRTNESRTNVDLFSISHYGLDSFCCTWNNHHLFVVCLFQPLRFSFFHLHLRYFYYFQSTTYFSVFFFFLCVIFVVCCCTRTPWPNVLFRAVRKNVRFFFHLFVCVCECFG